MKVKNQPEIRNRLLFQMWLFLNPESVIFFSNFYFSRPDNRCDNFDHKTLSFVRLSVAVCGKLQINADKSGKLPLFFSKTEKIE